MGVNSVSIPITAKAEGTPLSVKSLSFPITGADSSASRSVRSISFALPRHCITLLDTDTNPIIGADVVLDSDPSTIYTTDAFGSISIGVKVGQFTATKLGFQPLTQVFDFTGIPDGQCLTYSMSGFEIIFTNIINRYSFIVFSQAANFTIDNFQDKDIICLDNGLADHLPNHFVTLNKQTWKPEMIQGERYAFQINVPRGVNFDFNSLNLALVDNQGVITETFAPLIIEVASDGRQVAYADFTLDDTYQGNALRFMLYDFNTRSVVFVSNYFQIKPDLSQSNTLYLSYRNGSDINGFLYDQLPDYRNRIRIRASGILGEPEYDVSGINEVSTGAFRMQKTYTKQPYIIRTSQADINAHYALLSFSQHNDVEINGQRMDLKEGWKPEVNQQASQFQGNIEFYLRDVSIKNKGQ